MVPAASVAFVVAWIRAANSPRFHANANCCYFTALRVWMPWWSNSLQYNWLTLVSLYFTQIYFFKNYKCDGILLIWTALWFTSFPDLYFLND